MFRCRPDPTTIAIPSHNSRMLVGLFLFSGDQGGIEQKNRVRPYFNSRGLSPRKKRSYTISSKYHRVFIHASWTCGDRKRKTQTTHIIRMSIPLAKTS